LQFLEWKIYFLNGERGNADTKTEELNIVSETSDTKEGRLQNPRWAEQGKATVSVGPTRLGREARVHLPFGLEYVTGLVRVSLVGVTASGVRRWNAGAAVGYGGAVTKRRRTEGSGPRRGSAAAPPAMGEGSQEESLVAVLQTVVVRLHGRLSPNTPWTMVIRSRRSPF